MVSATCSCRSGLASLFLVAARHTAAVLLFWQLRPGTRIARLGAQAGLAVFLPLRSQTAMQTRSWLLRRAPGPAGSLLYFLSLRDKPPQCFCFGNFDQALVSHGSARKAASPLSFHPERSEGSLRSSWKFIVKITVTSRRCTPRTPSIERRHVELDHPQLRPGTRIARLGAQAGLALVFSSRAQRGIPTIFKEV